MVDSEIDPGAPEGLWRQAQRVLDGVADDGARQRLRRQKVIRLVIILGVMTFAAGIVLALVGHPSGHHPQVPADVPLWREVAGWSLRGIGLVVEVVGGVGLMRSGQFRSARRTPTQVLSRAERKELWQQVRGRRPVVPAQLPLARELAVRTTRQSHLVVMSLGLMVMMAAPLFDASGSRSLSIVYFSSGSAVCYGAAAIVIMREITRARLFLAQHPEPNATN